MTTHKADEMTVDGFEPITIPGALEHLVELAWRDEMTKEEFIAAINKLRCEDMEVITDTCITSAGSSSDIRLMRKHSKAHMAQRLTGSQANGEQG